MSLLGVFYERNEAKKPRLEQSHDRVYYTMFPDFTINWKGDIWYWEHEGMLHKEEYRNRQEVKHAWYKEHGFESRLIVTKEGAGFDSQVVQNVMKQHFK